MNLVIAAISTTSRREDRAEQVGGQRGAPARSRWRHQCATIPLWASVKARNTPIANSGISGSGLAAEGREDHRRGDGEHEDAVAEREAIAHAQEQPGDVAVASHEVQQPRKAVERRVGGHQQHQRGRHLHEAVGDAAADAGVRDLREHRLARRPARRRRSARPARRRRTSRSAARASPTGSGGRASPAAGGTPGRRWRSPRSRSSPSPRRRTRAARAARRAPRWPGAAPAAAG